MKKKSAATYASFMILLNMFLYSCSNTKKEYYHDGSLKSELEVDKNGILDGEARYYYQNGDLSSHFIFKDGKEEGKAFNYYENGKTHLEFNYRKGLLQDTCRIFYISGKLKLEALYTDGKIIYSEKYDSLGNGISIFNKVNTDIDSGAYVINQPVRFSIKFTEYKGKKMTNIWLTEMPIDKPDKEFAIDSTINSNTLYGTYIPKKLGRYILSVKALNSTKEYMSIDEFPIIVINSKDRISE